MPEEKEESKLFNDGKSIIMNEGNSCGLTVKKNIKLKEIGFELYTFKDLKMMVETELLYFKPYDEDKTTFSKKLLETSIKAWNIFSGIGTSQNRLKETMQNANYHYKKEMPLIVEVEVDAKEDGVCVVIAPRLGDD